MDWRLGEVTELASIRAGNSMEPTVLLHTGLSHCLGLANRTKSRGWFWLPHFKRALGKLILCPEDSVMGHTRERRSPGYEFQLVEWQTTHFILHSRCLGNAC
jgi:hypothetical protein